MGAHLVVLKICMHQLVINLLALLMGYTYIARQLIVVALEDVVVFAVDRQGGIAAVGS